MSDPARLRDSTQIVLPCAVLDGFRDDLTDEFTVTIVEHEDGRCRIVASPVVIQSVGEFLTKHGVPVEE